MPTQLADIQFSNLSVVDEVGRVFFAEGRIFRGIFPAYVGFVTELLESPFFAELTKAQLFPVTQIVDIEVDGFGLVVEHQKIHPVVYPYEWSFSMIKAAGLMILKINQIARKYGYETKDCQPYNVVFEGTRPVFIDLGSFQKIRPLQQYWTAYEEFFKVYYYPLFLAQKSGFFLTQYAHANAEAMPHEVFWSLRFPFWRKIFGLSFFQKMAKRFFKLTRLAQHSEAKIKQLPFGKGIVFLQKNGLLPFQRTDFEYLIRKISQLESAHLPTTWGDYHNQFYQNGKIKSSPRFDRILQILQPLGIRTVFEIAGNQGVFANLLLERLDLEYVICSDYDERAIDSMFRNNPDQPRLFPVLFNFCFPLVKSFSQLPEKRFRADLVVALAVTHHLILTQGISIEMIFREALRYAKQYLVIEFMPRGLYDGKVAQPLPDWYSRDWFRSHFVQYCELITEEQLEENRIVFVGRVR